MKKQVINILGINKPTTGFSHVVKAGDLIFLSSQISVDLKTDKIIPGNIKEQTKRAMENIKYLLSKSGSSIDDVVKVVIYFRNPKDRTAINEVYKQYFSYGQEPAKISVQAASPIEGIDIEIEATAICN